jgi:hypothetical protein
MIIVIPAKAVQPMAHPLGFSVVIFFSPLFFEVIVFEIAFAAWCGKVTRERCGSHLMGGRMCLHGSL